MTANGGSAKRDSTSAVRQPVQQDNKTKIQRPMQCKVLLLNGEEFEGIVDKRATGQVLFENVCEYLDLLEQDYFGLQFSEEQDPEHVKYWLDLNKKITKQKKKGKMYFEFALKFYPPDPTHLAESLTRYLVCLQIRKDIISGKLPCSQATLAMLGSYAVQADIGDYDPVDHGTGIDYIRNMPFAPEQTEDLLFKIAALHRQHKGQTPEQAELHYLEYAKKIPLYGIDLHKAKDSDYVDIMIGVGSTGISVYRNNLRINRFVWPKILKISYRRNKFLLRIRPAEFETFESWITFRLPNNKMAKRLWKISVEHHAFLRLRSAEDAKKRAGFPRFGSKYRYSGRTLYQTRLNASMADRRSKQFERTHSRQSLNTVVKFRSQDNLNEHKELQYDHQHIKNIQNLSLNINKSNQNTAPIDDGRTPFQSPLPQLDPPVFMTREIIIHNEEDFDEKLPQVPTDSPNMEKRPMSGRHTLGGVTTPLAVVNQPLKRPDSQTESESSSASMGSLDLREEVKREQSRIKSPPKVAPKPGKEKPPVAKKPEKISKEKASRSEKPAKTELSPKTEKSSKAAKPSKKEKEAAREVFM
ncbi:unnamed protein product [Candidula unifasciata]|uniref:FERM domain-containing protein n=1 Tax=Candidula unifasciata TaxID=100452 RepID=A0A8S4A5D3_9EUPU|nr:unnamed protein product [Candidula unifasciata]